MAVISETLKIVFLLSPGTGSTSTSKFLIDNFDADWVLAGPEHKHLTVNKFPRNFRELGFQYVTTTRNPFDFYISQYHKKKQWEGKHESFEIAKKYSFSDFIKAILPEIPDGIIHPSFINNSDLIFRKETLTQDIKELLEALGIKKTVKLPKINISKDLNHDLAEWYDEEIIDLIYTKHRDHFERFGYSYDTLKPNKKLYISPGFLKKYRQNSALMCIEAQGRLFLSNTSNNIIDFNSKNYSFKNHFIKLQSKCFSERRALFSNQSSFLEVIFPNTHSIFSDVISEKEKRIDVDAPSFIEKNCKKIDPNIKYYGFFRDRTDRELCFPETDSHWSDYGGYLAYRQICEDISVPPHDLSDKHFTDKKITGDLGTKFYPERTSISRSFGNSIFNEIASEPELVYDSKVEVTGKFQIFLNQNSDNEKTCIVFGDSYFYTIIKLLATHFKNTYFIHTAFIGTDINQYISPNVIISAHTERFLSQISINAPAANIIDEYKAKAQQNYSDGLIQEPFISPNLAYINDDILPLIVGIDRCYRDITGANPEDVGPGRICELYTSLFNRTPKLSNVIDKLRRHNKADTLIAEFINSDEFKAKYPST